MDDKESIDGAALQLFDYARTAEEIVPEQIVDGQEYVFYESRNPFENIAILTYDAEGDVFRFYEMAMLVPRLWGGSIEEGLSAGYLEELEIEHDELGDRPDRTKLVEADERLIEGWRDTDLYKDARFDL